MAAGVRRRRPLLICNLADNACRFLRTPTEVGCPHSYPHRRDRNFCDAVCILYGERRTRKCDPVKMEDNDGRSV